MDAKINCKHKDYFSICIYTTILTNERVYTCVNVCARVFIIYNQLKFKGVLHLLSPKLHILCSISVKMINIFWKSNISDLTVNCPRNSKIASKFTYMYM